MDDRTSATVTAYDDVAADYQEAWSGHRPLDAIRKFATLAGWGARVLDVATGPALDLRALRDAGLAVVAGDLSAEAVRVGKMLHPKGSIVRWDFRRLPFGPDRFAGLWAPAALQHLPRAEIRPAFAELRRVHGRGPIFTSFREGAGDLDPVTDPPAGTVYATTVSADELKALLLDAGYTQVEVETRADPLGRADVTWLYGWGQLPT